MHFNLQLSTACAVFGQMLWWFYWTTEWHHMKMPFPISFNVALPVFSSCPLYPTLFMVIFTVQFFSFFILASILFLVIPHLLYRFSVNLILLFPCAQGILSTVHRIVQWLNFHSSLIHSLMFLSYLLCTLLLFCLF